MSKGLAVNVPCVMWPSFPVWAVGWGPCGRKGMAWLAFCFFPCRPEGQDLSSCRKTLRALPPSLWQELFIPDMDSWLLTLSVGGYGPRGNLLCPPNSQAHLGSGQPQWGTDRVVAANGGLGLAQETSPKASVGSMEKQNGSWGYQATILAEKGEMIKKKSHFSSLHFVWLIHNLIQQILLSCPSFSLEILKVRQSQWRKVQSICCLLVCFLFDSALSSSVF